MGFKIMLVTSEDNDNTAIESFPYTLKENWYMMRIIVPKMKPSLLLLII